MTKRFLLCLGLAAISAGCTPQQPPQQLVATNSQPDELNVADAAIAGGDPAMALSVSQSVLKNNPGNVDALVHEGDAYYALNRCPASEAAYQLALSHDPDSAAAETGLGRCLIKTDPVAAEQALDEAVKDDPGNAAALNDLGIARDLQGNFSGAIDPYRRALLAEPGMTAAEVNLGLSLALSGRGAEALQYLGPLATGPDANAKTREDYAAALVAVGRIGEARTVLSIDLPPDQVNAALEGFQAVIANMQPPLVDQSAPPPPTQSQVTTTTVETTQLTPAAPEPAAPEPAAPKPAGLVSGGTTGGTAHMAAAGAKAPVAAPPKAAVQTAGANAPAAAASGAGGSYQVQLGALASQDSAQSAWDSMSGAMPALFGDKQPDIESATVNGHVYYRLRTGSFDSKADAAKFCGEVSAAGHACTLANF